MILAFDSLFFFGCDFYLFTVFNEIYMSCDNIQAEFIQC